MSRIWTVTVSVECATCGTYNKTSVAANSCEAARHHPGTILTDDPAERDHQ